MKELRKGLAAAIIVSAAILARYKESSSNKQIAPTQVFGASKAPTPPLPIRIVTPTPQYLKQVLAYMKRLNPLQKEFFSSQLR